MNYFSKIVSTLFFSVITTSVLAFSPYHDLTINTYWDPQWQDMEPMDLTLASQASGIKSYRLAFITDAGSCLPAWGAQSSYATSSAWGHHLTDKLHTQNVETVISFGGASGADISAACSDTQLLAAYEQVITAYQPSGLDFDIENGSADVAKIMRTLQKVQTAHPNLKISFTLPTLPEGLTSAGKSIVSAAQATSLNFHINIMAMDYGASYTNDMGTYAVEAATNLFQFLQTLYPSKSPADIWQMVEVTPMIGVNDVNTEQFTLTDVDTLRNFAKQNNIGNLSMWSVARDNPCSSQWASPTCSGDNLQTNPYDFAKRFLQ